MLNKGRIPEIARYVTENPDSYVLSSIVASIDREVSLKPARGPTGSAGLGTLMLPISARFLIHDGLHRRAAVEAALQLRPNLGDETISLILYVDPGFRRSEQIFSDLKRHESRSSHSQGILYDGRDELALITKKLVKRVDVFDGMTEMVHSKISNRSTKLFTLSGIYHATKILLSQRQGTAFAEKLASATHFWTEVANNIPDWGRAKRREISPAELCATCVHSHAITLGSLVLGDRFLRLGDQHGVAIVAASGSGLVEVQHSPLGGKGHDRWSTVQVQCEYIANGKRHKAAIRVTAHTRGAGRGKSRESS